MKTVLFAMVIASQLGSVAYAQKRSKAKTQKQLEITYQATKLGGYNFLQDGRRVAYSKPETEGDWTTQILYVCPNAKNKMAPKKDTRAIKVTPKEIVSIDDTLPPFFLLYRVLGGESWVPGNHIEDRFAIVLREKPDVQVKKRRVLPDAPERPTVAPADLSKFGNISVQRREITIKATGRTLKYFPNKLGGYTFTYDGKILLYSKAYDGTGFNNPMQCGSQSVWMHRAPNEDVPVATLWRVSEKEPFEYPVRSSIVDGVDIEGVLLAIRPILEQPNPVQPEKTSEDQWRELLGSPQNAAPTHRLGKP